MSRTRHAQVADSCILVGESMGPPDSSSRVDAMTCSVIAVAAFAVLAPFFWLGTPSGHDFEFHLNSWIEVVAHWKEGILYPHWAALAHYGYGEARFIFYPPVSWTLGGMLGRILPWTVVPAAYIWIALALSGFSMYMLARRWADRRLALFIAVLYMANPYSLVVVYWRGAMAELLAAAYVPLLFLWALRGDEHSSRVVPPLSVLLALGWLTNVPSAVMMNYSLALLVIVIAAQRRDWKPLANAALAVVAGAALACVYLVPAFHQQGWVSLNQVFSPGVRPADNFLFAAGAADLDHYKFNLFISWIAAWQMAILALAFVLWRRRAERALWWPFLAWSILSGFLMLKISYALWSYLPKLEYVQLPWRWLLCLNVPFAICLALAFRRWWPRLALAAVVVAAVPFLSYKVVAPWWDTAGDIREMVDNQHDGIGNEGADEYAPANADPYAIDKDAPPARFEGAGAAKVQVVRWDAEDRVISADAGSAGKLILRLFSYPLWKVKVNGKTVATEAAPGTGQLIVPIAAGANLVQITFVEGRDRAAGGAISVLALVLLGIWYTQSRKMSRPSPQSPTSDTSS